MLLFRCEYGSRAMGLNTPLSDHDVMEVHLEPREVITGLDSFETRHHSTAGDGRSGPGDTDTTVYGLRHWAALAAKGNPTAMTPLFTKYKLEDMDPLGADILANYYLFISKEAGRRYRGYSNGQIMALEGQRNKRTNRPELVHSHGYDTKFAYHALRTLMQGTELMDNGTIQLPIPDKYAHPLRAIRAGQVSKAEFMHMYSQALLDFDEAFEMSRLPERANYTAINDLLHWTYLEGWEM